MMQEHVEPPPIPLIKKKYYVKSDKDIVKLKLRRDPTPSMSDLYGFKMSLFDNGNLGDFLLFVRNFNIYIVASGMMEVVTKIQYIRTLVHG